MYNPLYNDTKPSCSICKDTSGVYRMYDPGNVDYSGDCFFLVGALNGMDSNDSDSFREIMRIIDRDLALGCYGSNYAQPSKPSRALNRNTTQAIKPVEVEAISREESEDIERPFSSKQRAFTPEELAFWGESGITQETLERFNVVAIEEYSTERNDGTPFTVKSTPSQPIYGYIQGDYTKLYRPKSAMRFSFGGKKDGEYCFGLEQLPIKGDVVYIVGGEKDALTLAARGFNAISFNGENATIPHNVIKELSEAFKYVVILYDMDSTGLKASLKQQELLSQFGVYRMLLPLPGTKEAKDVTDYFKLGNSVKSFRAILLSLLEPIYSDTMSILSRCEVNLDNPPPISKSIITINDVPLGTTGNLLCVTGGEGSGKSNFIGALIAGALNVKRNNIDTLGVTIKPNTGEQAILFYDTEQSEAQLFKNSDNIMRRANLEAKPEYFRAYSLTSKSRNTRLKLILDSMDRFHHAYGGIHMVVIDGIADLIRGANDEMESIAIVEELHRLAGVYNTCIICVLHFIPSGLKLRGHLGSELQRKAAAIVSIEKNDKTEVSVIKAIKVRDGSPQDVPIIQFSWSYEHKMHRYIGDKLTEEGAKAWEKRCKTATIAILEHHPTITYSELQCKLMKSVPVSERTAKSYIKYMRSNGFLVEIGNDDEPKSKRLKLGNIE